MGLHPMCIILMMQDPHFPLTLHYNPTSRKKREMEREEEEEKEEKRRLKPRESIGRLHQP